jgi:hypothetical protein
LHVPLLLPVPFCLQILVIYHVCVQSSTAPQGVQVWGCYERLGD